MNDELAAIFAANAAKRAAYQIAMTDAKRIYDEEQALIEEIRQRNARYDATPAAKIAAAEQEKWVRVATRMDRNTEDYDG